MLEIIKVSPECFEDGSGCATLTLAAKANGYQIQVTRYGFWARNGIRRVEGDAKGFVNRYRSGKEVAVNGDDDKDFWEEVNVFLPEIRRVMANWPALEQQWLEKEAKMCEGLKAFAISSL